MSSCTGRDDVGGDDEDDDDMMSSYRTCVRFCPFRVGVSYFFVTSSSSIRLFLLQVSCRIFSCGPTSLFFVT